MTTYCLPSRKKRLIIAALYGLAGLITASGGALTVYSLVFPVYFQVLTSSVHGAFFGLAIGFIGWRNLMALGRLKRELYKPTSDFSWSHFRSSASHAWRRRSH